MIGVQMPSVSTSPEELPSAAQYCPCSIVQYIMRLPMGIGAGGIRLSGYLPMLGRVF